MPQLLEIFFALNLEVPRLELCLLLRWINYKRKLRKQLNYYLINDKIYLLITYRYRFHDRSGLDTGYFKMPENLVVNRVGEIRQLTFVHDWYHFATSENSTDVRTLKTTRTLATVKWSN